MRGTNRKYRINGFKISNYSQCNGAAMAFTVPKANVGFRHSKDSLLSCRLSGDFIRWFWLAAEVVSAMGRFRGLHEVDLWRPRVYDRVMPLCARESS
jgi:hypothetical protein